MTRSMAFTFLAGAAAVALMVLCLWGWQHAGELAQAAGQPRLGRWAVQCAAIAVGALAQVILLTMVIGRIYQRQLVDDLLQVSAAVVLAVALVSAVALALAAR